MIRQSSASFPGRIMLEPRHVLLESMEHVHPISLTFAVFIVTKRSQKDCMGELSRERVGEWVLARGMRRDVIQTEPGILNSPPMRHASEAHHRA